tara:strand:+ start:186 stop:608 length:423 start_codon:yes stop_codon:yes gene_type:complete
MVQQEGSRMHPIDLTLVLNSKSGTWQVDDGADTDRGDPLADLCTERQQARRHQLGAQKHQRYELGAHFKVAMSLKSWFRKRNAQEDDYNYEAAELVQTRQKCTEEHEHAEACFQTLCMRFFESKRETWVNPSRNKCIPLS